MLLPDATLRRLRRAGDGRPDPRPTVREEVPTLGDLANEFGFEQDRSRLILDPRP
jgi:hypothetical protein